MLTVLRFLRSKNLFLSFGLFVAAQANGVTPTRNLHCEVSVDDQSPITLTYRALERINLEKEFPNDGHFTVAMKRDGVGINRVAIALAPTSWIFNLEPLSGPLLTLTNPGAQLMILSLEKPQGELMLSIDQRLVRVSCEFLPETHLF